MLEDMSVLHALTTEDNLRIRKHNLEEGRINLHCKALLQLLAVLYLYYILLLPGTLLVG
jgi:hypothetical protein